MIQGKSIVNSGTIVFRAPAGWILASVFLSYTANSRITLTIGGELIWDDLALQNGAGNGVAVDSVDVWATVGGDGRIVFDITTANDFGVAVSFRRPVSSGTNVPTTN